MLFIKFSFIFILIINVAFGSSFKCLNLDFETTISRKALMGFVTNNLKIKKTKCVIVVEQIRYKYLKTKRTIDVCREPIHIKKGFESIDVLKRIGRCDQNTNKFCKEWENLRVTIQDDGLIFADGEREKLTSQHGEVYCVYQLLGEYLGQGIVLSRFKQKEKLALTLAKAKAKAIQIQEDKIKNNNLKATTLQNSKMSFGEPVKKSSEKPAKKHSRGTF